MAAINASAKTTKEALAIAIAARVPTIIWGTPGGGKTSTVMQIAESLGVHNEVVIAALREPTDFAGLPIVPESVDEHGRYRVHQAAPEWAYRVFDAAMKHAEENADKRVGAILFFDELSTAPPAVQAALLRVFFEKIVGDLEFPENVALVAAANAAEDAADGWELSPPLANRILHLDWKSDVDEWTAGIIGGFNAPVVPNLDSDALSKAEASARALVAAFIHTSRGFFDALPDTEDERGRAWPSPRSWEMTAKVIAAAEVAGASEDATSLLVHGCVGDAAGVEFMAWRENLDLPDPEEMLKDPDKFVVPTRGDQKFAALSSITAAYLHKRTEPRWHAAVKIVGKYVDAGVQDLAAHSLGTLMLNRPEGFVPKPEELPEFLDDLAEFMTGYGFMPEGNNSQG